MTEEDWSTVEAHFSALMELRHADRASGLARIADEAIRREVASLLANADEGTLHLPGIGGVAADLQSDRTRTVSESMSKDGSGAQFDRAGRRLGPWRLLHRLGQGGQGTVFEAVRDDGAYEQRAAVKIVNRDIDSELSRRRFRHERRILAALEHPNIARLLDGGESSDGQPYLVMEFVEGRPLVAATAGWSVRRKLELFRDIVDAVAFAHRHLIVHRDLKPSNILVTADGVPKLLDFGIAKLIEEEGVAETGAHTVTSAGMHTPDYASPEQIHGKPAGIASDIYSLGAVLYELLSGSKPHRLESYSTADVYRAICLDELRLPSKRVESLELGRQLRGDLDTMVLAAMVRQPEKRYPSAEAFAAEIDRYLEGRPLSVRPASAVERWWKFARRNRVAVGAAAMVLLAVATGTAVSVREAKIANQRFQQVRRLAHSFVFDYNDELARVEGTTAVRERMVRTAVEYLDSLSAGASGDRSLQLELADAYQQVGNAQGFPTQPSLGHTDQAIASYRKAAAIRAAVGATTAKELLARANSYNRYAQLMRFAGNTSEAARNMALGLHDVEAAAESSPDDVSILRTLANSWCGLGDLDEDENRHTKAFQEFTKCDQIAGTVIAKARTVENFELAAGAKERIATSSQAAGRMQAFFEAAAADQAFVDEGRKLGANTPVLNRRQLFLNQMTTFFYYDFDGPNMLDPAKSWEYAERYLASAREGVERDPNNASAQLSLAIALFSVTVSQEVDDVAGALANARESIERLDKLAVAKKQSYLVQSRRAHGLRRFTEVLMAAGHLQEARQRAAEAVAEQRKTLTHDAGDLHEEAETAEALMAAGAVEDRLGEHSRALPLFEEAGRMVSDVVAHKWWRITRASWRRPAYSRSISRRWKPIGGPRKTSAKLGTGTRKSRNCGCGRTNRTSSSS